MSSFSNSYEILDEIGLRTPFYNFSHYERFVNNGKFEESIVLELLESNVFMEAIFLASPEFYQLLIRRLNEKKGDYKSSNSDRFNITLLKYLSRMTSRCTPFGLFAVCAVGIFSNKTNILDYKLSSLKKSTKFDMKLLSNLSRKLENSCAVKKIISYSINNSLYKAHDHFRYIEYTYIGGIRNYTLARINCSIPLVKIIDKSKNGIKIGELIELLSDDNLDEESVKEYVNTLIKNQILVSDFEINTTGVDYFEDIKNRLSRSLLNGELVRIMEKLEMHRALVDRKVGQSLSTYIETNAFLKKSGIQDDISSLFQIDSISNVKNISINSRHKKDLCKTLQLFNKITSEDRMSEIYHFKKEFGRRYHDTEVPLALVIDNELGIGYGHTIWENPNMIDSLSLDSANKSQDYLKWTEVDRILHKKLIDATKSGCYSIVLKGTDFSDLEANWSDLPDTFSAIIEILNGQNEKLFVDRAGGSSALNLISRFCNEDASFNKIGKKIAHIEENLNSDKILAEIIHLPQDEVGNILRRPILRQYEIPYIGRSTLNIDRQIPIDDLLVSLINNKIVLFSKKHKKEVIPIFSNAHNFNKHPLPIFKFLCDLQFQNKRGSIGFFWNDLFKDYTFLPRVEYGNVIISKATWNLEVSKIKWLTEDVNLVNLSKEWRKPHNIPQYVELVENDNHLLINFSVDASIKMFQQTVKNKDKIVLKEFIFISDLNNIMNQGYGCNQIVIFITKKNLKNQL